MATTLNTHSRHSMMHRTLVQKICIAFGVGFIVIGLAGIMMPGMMGMHLSMAHNLIHLASGALALWAGYADSRKAYTFCVLFGAVYGLLGILGFVIGQPGYPGVGHMEADGNLLRVIPNILEFGSSDHVVHILISAVLVTTAMVWKFKDRSVSRSMVDVQSRRDRSDVFSTSTTRPYIPNSQTDLKDAELGRSDVNRPSDMNRRDDFENRV